MLSYLTCEKLAYATSHDAELQEQEEDELQAMEQESPDQAAEVEDNDEMLMTEQDKQPVEKSSPKSWWRRR